MAMFVTEVMDIWCPLDGDPFLLTDLSE